MRCLLSRFWHSLPARLLTIFVLTAIAFMMVTSFMWGIGLRHQWATRIHPHIVQYVDYVNKDLGTPPSIERAKELTQALPIDIYVSGPNVEFASNGRTLEIDEIEFDSDKDNKKRHRHYRPLRPRSASNFDVGEHDDRTVIRTSQDDYTIYYELRRRDGSRNRSERGRPEHKRGKRGIHLLGLTLAGLLLVLAFCYWMIRRLISPIHDIQTGVRAMGAGQLDHRIQIKRNDDLGELTHSINDMASDIQRMLDAKRQLLLGMSHELRSPITRARVSTQLLPDSDSRDRIEEDLKEMEALITELLESERLNSRHSVLNINDFNVDQVVRDVIEEYFDTSVSIDSADQQTTASLDESRIRLLLRNLIGNARLHGRAEEVQVSIDKIMDTTTIRVRDSGVGIKAEDIAKLTEPMYRIDPSRTRSTGGFGMGLYLCKLIAEAHGGSLDIESKPAEGTVVSVTLSDQVRSSSG